MEINTAYIASQRDRIPTEPAEALYRIGEAAKLLPPGCLQVIPGSDTANAILCWLAINSKTIDAARDENNGGDGRSPIGVRL